MHELVFATNNLNKIREVRALLPEEMKLLSLRDIGCEEEIPETQSTIEANSLEKAVYVHEKYGYACFAEDSGLEVEALNNEPGVDSAYYSGSRDADSNIYLLLHNLKGIKNRKAQFKTVFTLVYNSEINQFSGIVTGTISMVPAGSNGFGYDPVFVPDGCQKTFAEMDADEKSAISHRTKAFNSMTKYLSNNF